MLGKVAADFVREADGWRLWHIVVSTDVDCQAGHDYGEYPVYEDWSLAPQTRCAGNSARPRWRCSPMT